MAGGSPFVCISSGTSISTGGQYLKNYPSSAPPPYKRLSTTHSRTASHVCNRLNIGTRTTAQQAPLPLTPQDWEVYLAYLQALMECVANNHNTCGLCRPGDLPQHMAPGLSGIIRKGGAMYFVGLFDRTRVFTGGVGKFTYDTTPRDRMVRKLNDLLPNYCIAAGLAPVYIRASRDLDNGRVAFILGL